MRNLKKILALVLALVMSFSLMATASAFSDDGDIAADYAEAIDVLSGLEVFKGYDNGATFQPKGSITRAEVAAIIYRIATGDVKDAQTSIYSSWGQFNDVKDGSWYAGYVNYCANAGYIKGYDSKTFGPNDPVTGYQALAMILRAIGYDKNNEFTGSNWQVRTASIAKQRGITDNIVDTLLGQSATREVVAEILFQSILVKTVTFNTNTLSYSENATSLGYDVLKLEKIEGVVVANQYADLADDEGMATGKTRIESADGDRTLNVVTTLDDIGESRYVYAKKTSNNGYNLVTDKMYDTGDNVIADKGEEIKVKDLAKEKSISVTENTEYFVNFSQATDKWTSDYLIRYAIAKNSVTDAAQQEFLRANAETKTITYYYTDNDGNEHPKTYESWIRTIKSGTVFDEMDKTLMKAIFDNAGRWVAYDNDAQIDLYTWGEVYVGTTSLKDYSDTMSWKGFRADYILEDLGDFDKTYNGNYLKLVDNNNDGIVEYALRTDYVLDEVVSVTTKDEKDTYYYRGLKTDADVVTPDGGDVSFKLDDVILYAEIDGKFYAEVVTPVSATIKAISFKDETVTTTDDVTYGQSAIGNETNMDDVITAMDEQVEYNVYLDKFGFVRAYELAQGSQYGLLTEMYPSRVNNGAFVNNGYWIAELMAGEDKAPAEYTVLNSYYGRNDAWATMGNTNPFIRSTSWDGTVGNGHPGWSNNNIAGIYAYNYLQEAAGHLGKSGSFRFNYGTTNAPIYSNTNVAKYTKAADGVSLYPATEYAYEKESGLQLFYYDLDKNGVFEKYTVNSFADAWRKAGNTTAAPSLVNPVYAQDYIELSIENIKSGAAHYTMADNGLVTNYASTNSYVDAVDDTEFFIVSGRSIQHFVGYKNMPKVDAKDIRAIYAVAENVNENYERRDYWVANVIVVEVTREFNYDSVVMAYFNNSQASRAAATLANGVKYFDVVDSENASITTLIPEYSSWDLEWDANYGWTTYGFYGVYDSAERDANTLTGGVDRLGVNDVGYNDNGVYAGTITREAEIGTNRAWYIDYNDDDFASNNSERINVNGARILAVGVNSRGVSSIKELNSYKELNKNDEIIIVKNAKGDVSFIVDIDYYADAKDKNIKDASWLNSEWNKIIAEQQKVETGLVTFNAVNGNDASKLYYQGEPLTDINGKDHYLPDYINNGYNADDWTTGKYVYIPASVFSTAINAELAQPIGDKTLIKDLFTGIYEVKRVLVDGVSISLDTVKNETYKGVPCMKIENNYQNVVVEVAYELASGVTADDMTKQNISTNDEGSENTPAPAVLDPDNKPTYTFLAPEALDDDAIYLAAKANDVIVRVDFKLAAGCVEPSVSVTIAGETRELKVYDGAEADSYYAFFRWNQADRVRVNFSAKGAPVPDGTYTVSLDTLPAGVTGVITSATYTTGEDTAVTLKVTTDATYTVRCDTVSTNAVVKIAEPMISNGTATWMITVSGVTADTKITLAVDKKDAPVDPVEPSEPADPSDPTAPVDPAE